MRTCRDCTESKPLDEFPISGHGAGGRRLHRHQCKPCFSIARGRVPGAQGRPKGSKSITADRIMDLLSISCEWWTVDGIAGRLGCSPRTVGRHVDGLHVSGRLRRRERLQNGVFEYQADPFWTEVAA